MLKTGANKRESKIIKTLFLVIIAFALCWAPHHIYFILYIGFKIGVNAEIYLTILVFTYLTVCINPFIYAISHSDVKRRIINYWMQVSISSNVIAPTGRQLDNYKLILNVNFINHSVVCG